MGGWPFNGIKCHNMPYFHRMHLPQLLSRKKIESPNPTQSTVQFALEPFRDDATLWMNGEEIPIAESVYVTDWPVEIEVQMKIQCVIRRY